MSIQTKTASSPRNAELGPYGNLNVGICNEIVEDYTDCCVIKNLDNPGNIDDFQLGALDTFSGYNIGKYSIINGLLEE